MRFKTGFVIGAAVGAWAARKAAGLAPGGKQRPFAPEEASEKLRALSGLARERLSDLVEGPIGTMARERMTDLLGASLSSATTERGGSRSAESRPIDVSGR